MEIKVCLGVLHEPNNYGNAMTEEHVEAMQKKIEKNGGIYGECEFPNLEGMSAEASFRRIRQLDLSRASHCISKVFTEENRVMAIVKPFGPYGGVLERYIEGDKGTVFSIASHNQPRFGIRGIKKPQENGNDLIDIVSFDLVTP